MFDLLGWKKTTGRENVHQKKFFWKMNSLEILLLSILIVKFIFLTGVNLNLKFSENVEIFDGNFIDEQDSID